MTFKELYIATILLIAVFTSQKVKGNTDYSLIDVNSVFNAADGLLNSADNRRKIFVVEGSNGSGESWADALGNLQEAINISFDGFEGVDIWLAEGIYFPDTSGLTDKRMASFILRNNVSIYGGFAGVETDLSQRDYTTNISRLSGDFRKTETFSDNSYSVVRATNLDTTVVLDGVTISDGSSIDNNINYDSGAGMKINNSDISVRNTTIENNFVRFKGGGVIVEFSNPVFYRVKVINNKSYGNGAGMFFYLSNPTINSCEILNNRILYQGGGGGLAIVDSDPIISNSIIANNESGPNYGDGGGVYCVESDPIILNSLVVNNLSYDEGAGIHIMSNSHPRIINSVLWGNYNEEGSNSLTIKQGLKTIIENSIIQGGNINNIPKEDYVNNIEEFPRFTRESQGSGIEIDALTADWSLSSCSPCIDMGGLAAFRDLLPQEDLNGNNRVYGDSIDIGPYEFVGETTVPSDTIVIYVEPGGVGDGTTSENATGDLQAAMDTPLGCYVYRKIILAEGVYVPELPYSTFYLRNSTELKGVINNNWDARTEDIQDKYLSVLSGNIGLDSDITNNSPHVITCNFLDSTTIISGVAIQDGGTQSSTSFVGGGGVLCNRSDIKLLNSLILNNSTGYPGGGGVYCANSKVEISNAAFIGNYSGLGAGGLYLSGSVASVINTKFINNNGDWAGGIEARGSRLKVIGCLIANNEGNNAGGLFTVESISSVINSTIVNNEGDYDDGGGIHSYDSMIIQNTIVYGNNSKQIFNASLNEMHIEYSNIEGGNQFDISEEFYKKNINEIPKFVRISGTYGLNEHALQADWSLLSSSPCINRGTLANLIEPLPDTDISGQNRVFEDSVDIGAYEFNRQPSSIHNLEDKSRDYISSIQVYPNPTKDVITVVVGNNHNDIRMVLRNVSGQTVAEKTFKLSEKYDFNIKGPNGIYFLEINNANGSIGYTKIVKNK